MFFKLHSVVRIFPLPKSQLSKPGAEECPATAARWVTFLWSMTTRWCGRRSLIFFRGTECADEFRVLPAGIE